MMNLGEEGSSSDSEDEIDPIFLPFFFQAQPQAAPVIPVIPPPHTTAFVPATDAFYLGELLDVTHADVDRDTALLTLIKQLHEFWPLGADNVDWAVAVARANALEQQAHAHAVNIPEPRHGYVYRCAYGALGRKIKANRRLATAFVNGILGAEEIMDMNVREVDSFGRVYWQQPERIVKVACHRCGERDARIDFEIPKLIRHSFETRYHLSCRNPECSKSWIATSDDCFLNKNN